MPVELAFVEHHFETTTMQTHTDFAFGFPMGAFFLFPLLYLAAIVTIVVIASVALWRIMKAQEATAVALERIARAIEMRSLE